MKIEAKSGFNWDQVIWTPPNEISPMDCSYCSAEIGEESVPLRMWNEDGAGIVFCDECAGTWFGVRSFEEP